MILYETKDNNEYCYSKEEIIEIAIYKNIFIEETDVDKLSFHHKIIVVTYRDGKKRFLTNKWKFDLTDYPCYVLRTCFFTRKKIIFKEVVL